MDFASFIHPLSGFEITPVPQRGIVLQLHYIGTEASGQVTERTAVPLALTAATAREMSERLAQAAAALEESLPGEPASAGH